MIAKTKVQMANLLADAMYSSYDRYRREQKLEQDTGLLKSFLIEAHPAIDKTPNHDEVSSFLRKLAEETHCQVMESDDETLFNVLHGRDIYYLDVSDTRFWIMHTLALSIRADKLRNNFIRVSPFLDNAWIPSQMLEKMTSLGLFKGFGAVHDETPFIKEGTEETEVETMHLRLWGGSAASVLEALRKSGVFPHSLALSSVRLKYWLPRIEDEGVIENFTFDGKVTALGKSFTSHINLVARLYEDYAQTVRGIENTLSIRFEAGDDAPTLEGHPIIISMTRELRNIPDFVKRIFSSALPFRLWGVTEMENDEFARVYAVDLHMGHKLMFEIARDFMRIYLPPSTCANTIARFYANIQHYYDSGALISGGPNERLFEKS
jgi:hypothetical protein